MDADVLLDALLGDLPGLQVACFGGDGACRLARGHALDGAAAGLPAAALLPDPWQAPFVAAAGAAADGRRQTGEVADPAGRIVAFSARPWPHEPGGAVLILRDVSAQNEDRCRLAGAEARFEALFDHSPVPTVLVAPDLVPVRANAAAEDVSGVAGRSRERGRLFDRLDPAEVGGLLARTQPVLEGHRASVAVEHTLVREDRRRLRMRSDVRHVRLPDGRDGLLVQSVDISERQGLADELERLTTRDPLTGLLNRAGLENALAALTARAGAEARPMSLLLADVDDFGAVNEALGAVEGDLVLRDVADALRDVVRDSDVLARTGPDEFALLLPGVDVAAAGTTAEAVMDRFTELLARRENGAGALGLTLSVGVTGVSAQTSLERLLAGASIAVYAAQQAGRGQWRSGI